MLTCKKTTELLSQEQDRSLGAAERFGLRFHLLFCAGCRNFRRQMSFLHRACAAFPLTRDDEERK